MAYCGNCGANVGRRRFCPNCGTMCKAGAGKTIIKTKTKAITEKRKWKHAFFTEFTIAVVALLVTLCISGVSSRIIVGRWEAVDSSAYFAQLEFFKDGAYNSDRIKFSGSYSINGDRLRIGGILTLSVTFTYFVSGDRWKLSNDGQEYEVYHRIK